jgi:steroid delta-isomerase-like uncharacterized protein
MSEHVEALSRKFINLAWNEGTFNLLQQYCTSDFHYHTTFNEQVLGFSGYVAFVKTFRRCMPDIELVIEEVMVKGEHAMVHSILSGTIQKPFFGLPASPKLITFSAISTLDIYRNKVSSLDSMIDIAGIQRQVDGPIAVNFPLDVN